jgi:hypothetical protein
VPRSPQHRAAAAAAADELKRVLHTGAGILVQGAVMPLDAHAHEHQEGSLQSLQCSTTHSEGHELRHCVVQSLQGEGHIEYKNSTLNTSTKLGTTACMPRLAACPFCAVHCQ